MCKFIFRFARVLSRCCVDSRRTFVQFQYEVFSLDEADALVLGGTASDDEGNDGDVVGGRVAGEDAEAAHRRAGLDRRAGRRSVADVHDVSHVVGRVDVTSVGTV